MQAVGGGRVQVAVGPRARHGLHVNEHKPVVAQRAQRLLPGLVVAVKLSPARTLFSLLARTPRSIALSLQIRGSQTRPYSKP